MAAQAGLCLAWSETPVLSCRGSYIFDFSSTEVEVQFYLDEYRTSDNIKAAIDAIPYIYGSTNSADALMSMHSQIFDRARGDRPDADNIAFMITDGISNINSRRTIPEAANARQKGIKIYAIGKVTLSWFEDYNNSSKSKTFYRKEITQLEMHKLPGIVKTYWRTNIHFPVNRSMSVLFYDLMFSAFAMQLYVGSRK